MTDDEVDELLNPPRQRPPLSAAAAGGLLLLPPLAMIGYVLLARRWTELLIPTVCLLVVVRPATNLLRGRPEGVGGGIGVLLLVTAVTGVPVVLNLLGDPARHVLLAWMPVLCWLAVVGVLVWWPATRRWCGLLPPAGPGDDE